jgi:hypothetical protein
MTLGSPSFVLCAGHWRRDIRFATPVQAPVHLKAAMIPPHAIG